MQSWKVDRLERKEGVVTLYTDGIRIEIPEVLIRVPIGDYVEIAHESGMECDVAFKGHVLGRSTQGTLVSNGGLLFQTPGLEHYKAGDVVSTYVSFG